MTTFRCGDSLSRGGVSWYFMVAVLLILGQLPGMSRALTISSDTVWAAEDSPHIVNSWVTVEADTTLIIEPGAEVHFLPMGSALQANIVVREGGRLVAEGTAAKPIVFTSGKEVPAPGDWAYLRFEAGSSGSIAHAEFEYGGQWGSGTLHLLSSDVVVADSVVRHGQGNGLHLDGTGVSPLVRDVAVLDCGGYAARINNPNASPRLRGLSATGNVTNAIFRPADSVTGHVILTDAGIPYIVSGWDRYQTGASLVIEPGVEVRFPPIASSLQGHIQMNAGSRLVAEGTASQPILFTHDSDTPTSGGWAGIYILSGAEASLAHCDIEYGGQWNNGQLLVMSSDVVVEDCRLSHSSTQGIVLDAPGVSPIFRNVEVHGSWANGILLKSDGQAPLFDGLVLRGNREYAIRQESLTMAPVYQAVEMEGNGVDGVRAAIGDIRGEVTLGDGIGTWHLFGWGNVRAGSTLTILPGTRVGFGPIGSAMQSYIGVDGDGGLFAKGTAEEPIVFTSSSDNPAPGSWARLEFREDSVGALEHCVLEYGGNFGSSLMINSSDVLIASTTVRHATQVGIQVAGAGTSPRLDRVHVEDLTGNAIEVRHPNTLPVFSRLSATGTSLDGILRVGGTSTTKQTWKNAGLPYVLDADLVFQSGASLTLDPGVEVWLRNQGGLRFMAGAEFHAVGTPFEPILFRGGHPDQNPAPWKALSFRDGSRAVVAHAILDRPYTGITMDRADVSISYTEIRDYAQYGIYINYCDPHLRYNRFTGEPGSLAMVKIPAEVPFVDAKLHWWGDPTGPHHDTAWSSMNPDGLGHPVGNGIQFIPWAMSLAETLGREAAPLPLDVPLETSIANTGFLDYQINVGEGEARNILVTLTPLEGNGEWSMPGSFGTFPTRAASDWRDFPLGGEHELLMPVLLPGRYHLTVYYTVPGDPGAEGASFRILARDIDRYVRNADVAGGGNSGTITQTIHGAGFEAGVALELRGSGGALLRRYTAEKVTENTLTVPMNLIGLSPQQATLHVVWGDGGSISVRAPFEILDGVGPVLGARAYAATVVRPNRTATVWIEYRNEGDVNMPAPFLFLRNPQGVEVRLSPDVPYVREDIQLLGLMDGSSVGILPPGATRTIPVSYRAGGSSFEFRLESALPDDTPVDWEAWKEGLRPAYIDSAAWDGHWNAVKTALGATWLDFHGVMTRTAQVFHDRGLPANGLNPLILHEINRATGLHPVAVISGRLLREETSEPMAGVLVSAISEDTEFQYSAMTDARGHFMLTEIPDGIYTLHVDGHDVSADTLALIDEQRDDLGVVVLARDLPPEAVLPPETPANTAPTLASDGAGRVMLAWNHGGELRTALFSGNSWQPSWASAGAGSNASLAWGPSLLGEEAPGWIMAWEVAGVDGVRHLQWALVQADGTTIQLTESDALTSDGASDFFPALVMEEGGGALVLWIQGIPGVDDFDLYFRTIDPAKAGPWRTIQPSAVAAPRLADTDCFEFTVGMGTGIPFVMQPIFGKSYEFNLAGSKCNEIPSCSSAGQSISGAMNVALGDTLTVGGGVEGSVAYSLQKKPCRYVFKKQAITVNGTIRGELDKPIPVFVGFVPIGTFYPNVAISGQATGSLIWIGRAGGLPTTGQVTFRPAGGGGGAFFAAGTKETNGLVAGSANVDISGLFTYSPAAGLDFEGMCVRLVGEAQIFYGYGRRKVTSNWGAGCGKSIPELGLRREVTGTMIRTIHAAIADGNVLYETIV